MAYYVAAAAVLAIVSLTALFAGDEAACNNVPSMTSATACQKTDNYEQLCQQTLQTSPDTAEVTVYAVSATKQAKSRYHDTLHDLDLLLAPANLPVAERLAVDNCKEKYLAALNQLSLAVDLLDSCQFSAARLDYYNDAVGDVRSCQEGLQPYQQFLPVFNKVPGDHDLTVVASLLGAIVVGS